MSAPAPRAWQPQHLRHLVHLVRYGANPAATVYDSLGADPWAAPAEGWLNVGLWRGDGDAEEAPRAPRQLVQRLLRGAPHGGVIVDVANGLAAAEPVIAALLEPSQLLAVNITESQLHAGRARLQEARASAIAGDATRLPLRSRSVDLVLSVEAAFHFPSRARFFAEVRRVLRPGGHLRMSDVSVEGGARSPAELFAGATNLRFWGVRRRNLVTTQELVALAERAGLVDIRVERCGASTIDPFVRFGRRDLLARDAPRSQHLAARLMLHQWALLRRRGIIDYVLLEARAPAA